MQQLKYYMVNIKQHHIQTIAFYKYALPIFYIQHNERFSEGGGLPMGSPAGGRTGVDSPQQQQHSSMVVGAGPVPGVVGQSGFGRGSPVGGNFDGPNNKRHRY